ncbi:hypothetical protein [Rhodovulum euryhalinum]|uniref:hypothetical protein n=1 Tax=Rhodovulum euryhalinum TaxID=35805 RepID=UPI00104F1943|nr:hypothetical protein [Rhodovulum euryhalinum]
MLYALAIGGLLGLISLALSRNRAQSRKTVISLDEINDVCLLRDGPVHAVLFRQSGNLYRDLGDFSNPSAACAEVAKSFRRAQIETLTIWQNSEKAFEVSRRIYNGRGASEGKKLGGAMVSAI